MSTAPAQADSTLPSPLLEAPARPVPLTAFERRFGHPPGLYVLFGAEMWERFSYYGMRALLILYMTKYLFLSGRPEHVWGYHALKSGLEGVFGPLAVQPLSSQIYGLYTGLVYLTPLFGGMLADRVLGQRKTVVIGGVVMAIGHFMMAFENLFFPALLTIILGNGCFKPNVSTQVGLLYPPGDPRRDRAFSVFYVGINLGGFLSPLVCGALAATLGWHYGFAAAGVGMCLGVVVYLWGQRYLAPDTLMQARARGAVSKQKPAPFTRKEWASIVGLIALCLLNAVFWALYEQQGNTMQLWADQQTIWPTVFGWQIPSTWFQSFNSFMIFGFTPLLTFFWARQARKKKEPSSVVKMAIGCTAIGLSYLVMVLAAFVIGGGKGSLWWPTLATAIATLGELYLSPIGLSLVTKAAPARIVSMMMGMWFCAMFLGNYLAGYIGSFYSRMPRTSFFFMLILLGVGAGAAIFALKKPLHNAIGADL